MGLSEAQTPCSSHPMKESDLYPRGRFLRCLDDGSGGGGRIKVIGVAIAVLVVVTMWFAVVGPAVASNHYWATGADVRLRLVDTSGNPTGDFTYPADTPFYVAHGWLDGPWNQFPDAYKDAYMGPATYFELSVDGVPQHSSKQARFWPDWGTKGVLFISEYDLGMTGMHTFEGRWYLDGYLTGGTPGEAVLVVDYISVVTFI